MTRRGSGERWVWRDGGRAGISTAEVLVSVAVIATLAAVALPSLAPAETARLEGAARILAADLAYARSLAVQFNTQYALNFDLANNRYDLVHAGPGPAPAALVNPRGAGDAAGTSYRVTIDRLGETGRGNNGVRLAGAALATSQANVPGVTFGPLGGTGPTRTENTVIWLTAGTGSTTRYVRITVSWVTGQAWVDPPEMLTNPRQLFDSPQG